MPITRDQVAQLANVSSATVSRVFNNPQSVSPPLQKAVLEAAGSLGYTPNKAAGLLRRRGTGVLAFVELEKEERPYYWGNLKSFDWFFGRSLRGVQRALKDSSWQLRFYKVKDKKALQTIESQCDGIIAYDVDTDHEVELFESLNVPYVLSHHMEQADHASLVVTDNTYGGVLQGTFLKDLGCTHPVYVTGYTESVVPHRQRLDGFLSVFPQAVVLETTIGSNDAIEKIIAEIQIMIAEGKVDGFAAVNDLTLFELLLRLSCPLPGVGYDASPFYRLFSGPVASVDIRSGELYEAASNQLISLLGGAPPEKVVIKPSLIRLN